MFLNVCLHRGGLSGGLCAGFAADWLYMVMPWFIVHWCCVAAIGRLYIERRQPITLLYSTTLFLSV